MRHFFYFVKEAFRGLFQAKLMTLVSVVTIAATLFLLGIIGMAYLTLKNWIKTISGGVELVAYLDDKTFADSAMLGFLIDSLRAISSIEQINIVNKDSAWKRFEALYGTQMLEAVEKNPFPASVEIKLVENAQSVASVTELKSKIERIGGVEGVSTSIEWISKIETIRKYFLGATFVVGAGLLFALQLLISNSVKLTIYARKDLITNMYFVGATSFFIKMPFILEGIVQGLFGAVLAFFGLSVLAALFSSAPVVWGAWTSYLLLIPAGVVFGWIGSLSAVRKFLR